MKEAPGNQPPQTSATHTVEYNPRRRRSITFAEEKTVAEFDPKSKACNAFHRPRKVVFDDPSSDPATPPDETETNHRDHFADLSSTSASSGSATPPKRPTRSQESEAENAKQMQFQPWGETKPQSHPTAISPQIQQTSSDPDTGEPDIPFRPSNNRPLVRLSVNLLATYQNIAIKEGPDDVVFTSKPMSGDADKWLQRLDQSVEQRDNRPTPRKKRSDRSRSRSRERKKTEAVVPDTGTTTADNEATMPLKSKLLLEPKEPVKRRDSFGTTVATSVTTLSSTSPSFEDGGDEDSAPIVRKVTAEAHGRVPPKEAEEDEKTPDPSESLAVDSLPSKLQHQKSPTSVVALGLDNVSPQLTQREKTFPAKPPDPPVEVAPWVAEHHAKTKKSHKSGKGKKSSKPPKSPSASFGKEKKTLTLDDVIKPKKSPKKGRSTRSLSMQSRSSERSSSRSKSRRRSRSQDAAAKLTPVDLKQLKRSSSKSSSSKHKGSDEEKDPLNSGSRHSSSQTSLSLASHKKSSRKKSSKDKDHVSSSPTTPKESSSPTPGTPKRKPSRRRRSSFQAAIPQPPVFVEFEPGEANSNNSAKESSHADPAAAVAAAATIATVVSNHAEPTTSSLVSPLASPQGRDSGNLKDLYAEHYRSILMNSPRQHGKQIAITVTPVSTTADGSASPGTTTVEGNKNHNKVSPRRFDTSLVKEKVKETAEALGHSSTVSPPSSPKAPSSFRPLERNSPWSPTRRSIPHSKVVTQNATPEPLQHSSSANNSLRPKPPQPPGPPPSHAVKKRRRSSTGSKKLHKVSVVVIVCTRIPNKAIKVKQENALATLREQGIRFDVLDDGADPANDAILNELFDISGLSRGETAYPQFFAVDENRDGPFVFKGDWGWFESSRRDGELKKDLLCSPTSSKREPVDI